MRRTMAAIVAMTFVFEADRASANLIINGTFESADATNALLPAGWTASNFDVFSRLAPSPAADPDGGAHAMSLSNLASDGFATIEQSVITANGATYNLSYWFFSTGTSSATPPAIDFRVLWNGNIVDELINPLPVAVFNERTVQLTGTGHDTLAFEGFNNPGFNYLDDVNLDGPSPSAVPEPASLTIFGIMATFGFCGCAPRRKSRSAT